MIWMEFDRPKVINLSSRVLHESSIGYNWKRPTSLLHLECYVLEHFLFVKCVMSNEYPLIKNAAD